MTEPARRNADGPASDDPERKPDPRAAGWADVQQVVISDSHLVALAAAGVADRPGDDDARVMLGHALRSFDSAITIAGRCAIDAAVIEAVRARAHAEGYAAGQAARCRLAAVPDA